ncbi:hypothetical protein FA95DRAFT_648578 [Auriscalpium vulgare]|uniref:Uncharacterized protein n=1 Tax=Auriscalpium vulgare TaxID=40419 RepID=A0ACB8RD99_9AGAM|nr:hypothetical protein FA95DRAFT_648578 [Auriscalpium vulgare]
MLANPLSQFSSASPALVGQSIITPKPSWALPDSEAMRTRLRIGLQDLQVSQKSARSRVKWAGRRAIYQVLSYRQQRTTAPVVKIPVPRVVIDSPELPTYDTYGRSVHVPRPVSQPVPIKKVVKISDSDVTGHLDVHEAAHRAGKSVVSETARFPIRPTDDAVLDALTDAPKYPMWRPPVRRMFPSFLPRYRHEEPSPAPTIRQLPALIPDTDSDSLYASDSDDEVDSLSTVRPDNVLVNMAGIGSGHTLVGRAPCERIIKSSSLKGRRGNKGLGIWDAFSWSD